MALLAEDDAQYLRDAFANLASDVTVTVVTRQRSALVLPGEDPPEAEDASREVKQIVDEVAATAPRVRVEHLDVVADSDRADAVAGGRIPAIVFSSAMSKGRLRYYGLPAGYEMSTLIGRASCRERV